MTSLLRRLSGSQQLAVLVLAAAISGLAVLEGFDPPTAVTAIAMTATGLLPPVVLLLTDGRLTAAGAVAGASIALSVLCVLIPGYRPEHTFGFAELFGLSLLAIVVVMRHAARPAAGAVAVLLLAVFLLPFRLRLEPADTKRLMGTVLALGVAFALLLGLYLRLRGRRRVDVAQLAWQAQRLEYARDLHDFVAHHVTAIVAQTQAIRYTSANGHRPATEDLDLMLGRIERAGSQALVSMRNMITMLRSSAPAPENRYTTLGELLSTVVDEFVTAGPAPVVAIEDGLAELGLPERSLDAAHHVVLEALTNVLRHATAVRRIDVRARLAPGDAGQIEVTVCNDGRPAEQLMPRSGFGLTGLAERVEAAGGRFSAGPAAGGWQVTAQLPAQTGSGRRRSVAVGVDG